MTVNIITFSVYFVSSHYTELTKNPFI